MTASDTRVDWGLVETVFLDMDGTLLDLHFDNHFWLEHLPQRYAELKRRPLDEVKAELFHLMQETQGHLNWYCLDFWRDALEVDIVALKHEVADRIQVFPHVVEFLQMAGQQGKRLVLLTNAHRDSLALKFEKTALGEHFDRLISSHDLGIAKEGEGFWERLQEHEPFEKQQTLLVDDNLSVLRAARAYGLGHLRGVARPDSNKPPLDAHEFPVIRDFRDLGLASFSGA